MTDLASLIERVSAATGPDREVDADIAWAVERNRVSPAYWNARTGRPAKPEPDILTGIGRRGVIAMCPPYTASVDAVLALAERVLPGWRAELRVGEWPAHIERHDVTLWNNDHGSRESVFGVSADAPTLPLAILLAILKAKAAE